MEARTSGSDRRFAFAIVSMAAVAVAGLAGAASNAARARVVTFRTPNTPVPMVAAYGSVWVAGHRGGGAYRISPKRNRIVAHLDSSDAACDLWAQLGRVYVGGCEGDSATTVIDARTDKVVGHLRETARLYAGSLWTFRRPGLVRLDPKTHVVLKTFRNVDADVPLGFGYGSVWAGTSTKVTRIVAATNRRVLIPLPGAKPEPDPGQGYANPWRMAFAGAKAWFGNPAGIFEIATRTNRARLLRIPIGPFPDGGNIDLVAGVGSVWAGTSEWHVVRIDPGTGHVVGRYPGGGGDIAFAWGSLWVTKPTIDSVWRVPIH